MNPKGFTLIELLVVAGILSILTTLGLNNFHASQIKARDLRRKQDLQKVQQALRLYYQDHASFPLTDNLVWGSALQNSSHDVTYINDLPLDPSSSSSHPVSYHYASDGTVYILGTNLENSSDSDIVTSHTRCPETYPGIYTTIYAPNDLTSYVVCEE